MAWSAYLRVRAALISTSPVGAACMGIWHAHDLQEMHGEIPHLTSSQSCTNPGYILTCSLSHATNVQSQLSQLCSTLKPVSSA